MLSYRHSFHAGNFADVIKHIVIVEILQYLCQKDKAFEYIDTHAGAGLFNLDSDHATKLHEYSNGIAKLDADDWPELTPYFDIIKSFNEAGALTHYPGSPMIARHFLRSGDKAWLYELHPADVELLRNNVRENRQIRVKHEDGFKGLLSLLPPLSRRGFVLIDPPYEIKTDYQQVVNTVIQAHKKFSTGTYAIWYPVVDRTRIDQLEKNFIISGIKNIQRFELALAPDSHASGMTASGMIVINPPWTLMNTLSQLLPKLVAALADDKVASFKCDVLVAE
ncbi:MAG: 23S rRNA (adenine(2030)-N(6))-methyltransferase RlmJ [Gammaproteobacteria bacterium]|nr:23S rRNA (adenine(2030)-N(6))-methyltransferase RlmJ [Gammaproteobacteria bacterium]